MRRVITTGCVLLLSTLALMGGPTGLMLCLHQATLHVTPGTGSEETPGCSDDEGELCGQNTAHECDGCVDVAVKGLDLAQLRFEEGVDLDSIPSWVALPIARFDWPPMAERRALPGSRAPPAQPQSLIVVNTSVLLI